MFCSNKEHIGPCLGVAVPHIHAAVWQLRMMLQYCQGTGVDMSDQTWRSAWLGDPRGD